jgi:tetratricopeptide (TPR) repeat protein
MRLPVKHLAIVFMVGSFLSPALFSQSSAGDELNLGVQAYREAKYEEAIQHFEKSVALAPDKILPHLYLATAYAQQYIPGVDTPDNKRFAEQAIEQYQRVLDSDSVSNSKVSGARISSAKGIASLYYNMKKFDDSKKYNQMVSDLDPKDPDPYYSIGVIDWALSYQPRMEQRARLDVKPDAEFDPNNEQQRKACDQLRAENSPVIEEGITSLHTAIKLQPDYDDAMAYLNLMYREKADLACDDLAARAEDLETADHWVDETLRVKKQKAENSKPVAAPMAPNPQ